VTINITLLTRTLEYIEAHPLEWVQSDWTCGTAGCFAWHAAILDGARRDPAYEPDEWVVGPSTSETEHVSDYAEAALGLSGEQADQHFGEDNTLADLRRIVGELTGDAS
jgi:hypothetical protein